MFAQLKNRIRFLNYTKNLEVFNTSSEGERWCEFERHHVVCKESFNEDLNTEGLEDYIETYKKNGFFTYQDEQTERLCKQIYDKLKAEGFTNTPNPEADHKEFLNSSSHLTLNYEEDAYLKFPEIEEIFRGKIGDIIRGIFGCNFDIFYSRIFKNENDAMDERDGSQLWHSDGGPSNCMIMFFHFTDVGPHNGGTEILPWETSKQIYKDTYLEIKDTLAKKDYSQLEARYVRNCIFEKEININYKDEVVTLASDKPGLVAAMNNNNLHRGGFTKGGNHRVILMTHLYPTNVPTPFETYRKTGRAKKAPIPDVSTLLK